jgi:hypothetical protein
MALEQDSSETNYRSNLTHARPHGSALRIGLSAWPASFSLQANVAYPQTCQSAFELDRAVARRGGLNGQGRWAREISLARWKDQGSSPEMEF